MTNAPKTTRKKRALRSLAQFAGGLLVAHLVLCAYLANRFIHPLRVLPTKPAGLREGRVGTVPVWITRGLAEGKPSKAVVVLAHGFGGSRATWGDLMLRLEAAGIDAVAPAMPGQEASPQPGVTFGKEEATTLIACAAWARAHGAKKVVGEGLSLGGAATWLASGEDPKAFDGIVTDAAFARFDGAMESFLGRKAAAGRIVLRPVVWFARAISGIDPASIRPIDAARAWRGRPALVIQGTGDTLIVPSNGERLAQAAGCPLWRIEGAEHSRTYAADPKAYASRVIAFVQAL